MPQKTKYVDGNYKISSGPNEIKDWKCHIIERVKTYKYLRIWVEQIGDQSLEIKARIDDRSSFVSLKIVQLKYQYSLECECSGVMFSMLYEVEA